MAITATVEKKQYYMNLNNGSTTTGAIRVKKLSLASFIAKNADDAKAYNIMAAIEQCLAKSVYYVSSVVTSELENN